MLSGKQEAVVTAYVEPYVASLWKEGSPDPFAFEELQTATNLDDAKKLALEWAEENISLGGLVVPTLLYVKYGSKSELVRKWQKP
jgi:hypothetical protein